MSRYPKFAPLAVAFALALAGCATPGPILTSSVGTIRTGLDQADQQSELVFHNANATAREIDIVRVLANPAPNLREDDFPLALAPDDIEQWSNAFGALDRYLATVQKLVDPARATATADNLDGLAKELREGPLGLKLPGAATAAFSTFAGALVQARAERSATGVMRRVDPAFTEVMSGMADAVGADDKSGLRQTIRLYWAGKLANLRTAYAAVPPGPADARKAIVLKFTKAMDDRDTQLRDLGGLRTSLLALGEAHSAAARGDGGDALFWIGRIGGWLDDIKRRTKETQGDTK